MKKHRILAIIMALAAAVLYAVNIPLSKMLLQSVEPVFMSAFLYLGAGAGIGILYLLTKKQSKEKKDRLTKAELPYTIGMIVLDIAAPIFLMIGLTSATAANASLLNNFEIVSTAIVALLVFKELISKRLWVAILFITLASMLLSLEGISGFRFSVGSLFVLAACVCWGFENNCTRKMSSKNTFEIVTLKGIFSGVGSFLIAMLLGEKLPTMSFIICIMLLGFVSFGLSIFCYIRAQNELGAAKTSAFYAVAPFIGSLLSYIIFQETLGWIYFTALLLMLIGAAMVVWDTFVMEHTHLHTHTIVHTHDGSTHTHIVEHTHLHTHSDSEKVHTHQHEDLS